MNRNYKIKNLLKLTIDCDDVIEDYQLNFLFQKASFKTLFISTCFKTSRSLLTALYLGIGMAFLKSLNFLLAAET